MYNTFQNSYSFISDIPNESLSDEDVIVQFFDTLFIHTKSGILTESEITSSLVVQLITYMFINSEKKISQRELSSMLWSNSEVISPNKQVQNVVHRARKILSSIFPYKLISSDKSGNYFINPQFNIITDIATFDHYFCLGTDNNTSLNNKIEHLLHVLQIYKNMILPNYVGNNWLDNLRTHYHLLYLQTVFILLPILFEKHAYSDVYAISSTALLYEPENSDIHFWYIRAMNELGGHDIAHKHFLQHIHVISEEQRMLLSNIISKR